MDYLLLTQIGCIPNTSGLARRHALPEATPEPTALYIRGAKPPTFTPLVKKKAIALPKPLGRLKRQAPANATGSPLVLTGEPFRLIEQLFTVLYAIGVINSGADLGETCLQLQSAVAIRDLAGIGLDAIQAAAVVCTASLPNSDLASFNQTLIASAAAGLYGVQLAANFTGTVDTSRLCNQLDLSSLPALGVDVNAVRSFVCSVNNSTSTNGTSTNGTSTNGTSTNGTSTNGTSTNGTSTNGTSTHGISTDGTLTAPQTTSVPTNAPSAGTLAPFPNTNSSGGSYTWAGSLTVTGPVGSFVTAPWGTGRPASGTGVYPMGNVTAVASNSESGTAVHGTGNVVNATAIGGTGNLPVATDNAGPSTVVNGTGDAPAGIGPVGSGTAVSATSDASAAYASSSADSWSSHGGYGQDTTERVPHGPTSTPRYYAKYF